MKREIKFRGVSTNTGKFIYGYFNYDWDGKGDLKPCIQSSITEMKSSFTNTIIDINTLSQYTGLKDKNGKEIYEGDILREPPKGDWDKINYGCYEVFFHDGDANSDYNIGYCINRSHYHGAVCGGIIPQFKPKQVSKMIVIGNIYESPELLTK